MSQPLLIGHHLIFTAYACWLPNDPRGSLSHVCATDVLRELGELHYGRKQVQPPSGEIRSFYARAEPKLKHPRLTFGSDEILFIADAFRDVIKTRAYTVYACAIMPDHVHVSIRKHRDRAEEMIEHLQESSRLRLRKEKLRSLDHPVWGGAGWKVFLHTPDDFVRTNRYVEENPIKQRLPAQAWDFVKRYDQWPLHEGHSPNSPYAKGLRSWVREGS